MATATNVQLTPGEWPQYYRPGITQGQAKVASDLLQENHERNHIFFNADGFHNHIAHHLLSIWALKASPETIRQAYKDNSGYQRHQMSINKSVVDELSDPAKFMKHLGPEKNYPAFLEFFTKEMEASSWQSVLQKYMFARDNRADTMLVRMYAGFLHPIIHLGFGVEFHQPAIVAEALAQAACHDKWIGNLLLPAEEAAKSRQGQKSKSIVELLDELHADKQINDAPHWSDGNKIRDGILARAGEKMVNYASQYHVQPSELKEKTAEMTNAVAYYTFGAQHPPNKVMVDFYYMHCLNSSIFFSAFLSQPWLSDANKVRLLEWKVRLDIAMYASRKSPTLHLSEIRNYKPKKPSGWDEIQDRVCRFPDDGHAAKLIRALAHGQRICEPFEGDERFRIKHDDWLQMGHMAIDSIEGVRERRDGAGTMAIWVRSAGFEEAWEDVPTRAQL